MRCRDATPLPCWRLREAGPIVGSVPGAHTRRAWILGQGSFASARRVRPELAWVHGTRRFDPAKLYAFRDARPECARTRPRAPERAAAPGSRRCEPADILRASSRGASYDREAHGQPAGQRPLGEASFCFARRTAFAADRGGNRRQKERRSCSAPAGICAESSESSATLRPRTSRIWGYTHCSIAARKVLASPRATGGVCLPIAAWAR
jgi:hypothetical protein